MAVAAITCIPLRLACQYHTATILWLLRQPYLCLVKSFSAFAVTNVSSVWDTVGQLGVCQFLPVPSFSKSNNSLIGRAQAAYVYM